VNRYEILITQSAEADLQGITDYIARELQEPFIAQKMINKIIDAVTELELFPLRNGYVQDETLAALGIRKFFVDSYLIFYVVDESRKKVTIIRILYAKRNWIMLL
jgi:addiction module RelE/StbE family toxin